MNKNNFVNVVGYQLEKVHTGVIKWIMDTTNSTVSMDDKFTALERLYKFCNKRIPYDQHDIASITCLPEFAFGRKRKIDLVMKVTLKNGSFKFIVIEMKVDSIPNQEQLVGTFNDFKNYKENTNNKDVCYMLFLLGSSLTCQVPTNNHFSICRVNDIIGLFGGLSINEQIYLDWIESLTEEQIRADEIIAYLNEVEDIWQKDFWLEKGYRTWFPLFYYIYAQLKSKANNSDEWTIYSGNNNPVMNWLPGWKSIEFNGKPVSFYWEFNYDEFVLKAKVDPENPISKEDLIQLRNHIAQICDSTNTVKGNKTRNTYGTYTSLYKWKFNFKKQNFPDVMATVDDILLKIPPNINNL